MAHHFKTLQFTTV